MFTSYRNQSVDLQSKSTDWFLYDGNIGRLKVKVTQAYFRPCETPMKELFAKIISDFQSNKLIIDRAP